MCSRACAQHPLSPGEAQVGRIRWIRLEASPSGGQVGRGIFLEHQDFVHAGAVHVEDFEDLPLVLALNCPGLIFGSGKSRQQQASQNRNDGCDDEQLDQSERKGFPLGFRRSAPAMKCRQGHGIRVSMSKYQSQLAYASIQSITRRDDFGPRFFAKDYGTRSIV